MPPRRLGGAALSAITIRPFETVEEYRACVALQEETWGRGFSERVPPAILKVARILGGVSSGAYDADGRLVGFVFGMTGQRDGELVHWSDMLAVREDLRDSGLGTRLKAYQRNEVLGHGVQKMLWTFDPLQSRNAHVNFNKLGIVVREYAENMYGETDSPLHRGIGTDRFIALWLLASERVSERLGRALAGTTRDGSGPAAAWTDPSVVPVALDAAAASGRPPRPLTPDPGHDGDAVAARIPSDILALMADDMGLARAWRAATREAFRPYLDRGYEVSEFARGEPTSTYLMTRIGS